MACLGCKIPVRTKPKKLRIFSLVPRAFFLAWERGVPEKRPWERGCGVFTLKTHHVYSVHATLEEFDTLKFNADIFKFLRSEEHFRKALSSWRISVDSWPYRRILKLQITHPAFRTKGKPAIPEVPMRNSQDCHVALHCLTCTSLFTYLFKSLH